MAEVENKKVKMQKFYKDQFQYMHKDFEFQYKNIKKYIDIWVKDAMVKEEFDNLAKGKVEHSSHISYMQDKFGQHGRALKELSRIFFAQQRLCNEILVEMFDYPKAKFDENGRRVD
tara:strand:+ start:129 stop:476 length:348 start_codon:yes stop_codon:yes gene_type:complete